LVYLFLNYFILLLYYFFFFLVITIIMIVLWRRTEGKERRNKAKITCHVKIIFIVLLSIFLLPAVKLLVSPEH